MTTVAVLAEPPREGNVLPEIVDLTPLSESEAADLYAASLADVIGTIAASGAELLVNYRSEDQLPERPADAESAEDAVRAVVDAATDADDVRFEVQVGSTPAARMGNTITHLLDGEEVKTAAVVPATAATTARTTIDQASMQLRRSDVVLGPTPTGRTHYAGFTESIDFEDALTPPEVETLATRAAAADHEIDFLPMQPIVETPAGLRATVSWIRARRTAEKQVPAATAALIEELGLRVGVEDGERTLVRGE